MNIIGRTQINFIPDLSFIFAHSLAEKAQVSMQTAFATNNSITSLHLLQTFGENSNLTNAKDAAFAKEGLGG